MVVPADEAAVATARASNAETLNKLRDLADHGIDLVAPVLIENGDDHELSFGVYNAVSVEQVQRWTPSLQASCA